MKYLEQIGWDNGYDSDKLMLESSEAIIFPSVSYLPKQSRDILIDEDNSLTIDKISIQYNDKLYFLGNYAIQQDGQGGNRNFEYDKFKDESEVAKLLAGIALHSNEKSVEIGKLVGGLSIRSYYEFREEFIDFYKDRVFHYKTNGEERKVIINDVMCIPQGIGAYYDEVLTYSGAIKDHELLNERYGLVDIGGNTVDAFAGKGMVPTKGTDVGLGVGLSDAFKAVDPSLPYNIIQFHYLNGEDEFKYGRKTYRNLQSRSDKQFELLAEEIYTKLLAQWNRYLDNVHKIILTGGGAKAVGGYLKKKFINRANKEVILMDDPQISNVKGYYKLGVYQNKRVDKNEG
jgi:hypothetical protein